jgi:hypothetical protein
MSSPVYSAGPPVTALTNATWCARRSPIATPLEVAGEAVVVEHAVVEVVHDRFDGIPAADLVVEAGFAHRSETIDGHLHENIGGRRLLPTRTE